MFGRKFLKELFLHVFFVLLLFACFASAGCDSLTKSPTMTGDVIGKIYGFNNSFLSEYRVTVSGRSVITDNYGRFSFSDVEYPYDLLIYDSVGKKCAYYPRRDSITRDILSIGILSSSYNMRHSILSVSYPAGIVSGSGKLVFTDNADKNLYGILAQGGGEIELDMSYGTQYEGRIIVLAYSADNSGRIISYDKYCIKNNIVLNAGTNLNVNLTPQDFRTNIINKKYRVNLVMLPNQNADVKYAYLTFGNRFTYNFLNNAAFEIITPSTFDLTVPDGLGIACYPIVGFNTKQNTGTVSYSSVFDVAGMDMTISSPVPPVLVYPPDNAFIDTNTEFVFNQGLSRVENKFYKINFFNTTGTPSKCLYYDVYIDRERFKASELNNIGIENVIGSSFEWSVEVYENICLNDYIRDVYPNNRRYMTECVKRKVTIKQ